ncbi:MAG: hypothetical protein HC848_08115 [Limnobacter sp.]|nr:hypothetical protein [Limnobacter sp.]
MQVPISAATFKSALAIKRPAPALTNGDTLAIEVGGLLEQALVEAGFATVGLDAFADTSFFWLDHRLDRNTIEDTVLVFKTSSLGLSGDVLNNPPPNSSTFQLANLTGISVDVYLLVSKAGPGGYDLVKVTALNGNNATVQPPLTASVGSTNVSYWLPSEVSGRVFPSLFLDATNNAWDSGLLRLGDIYFPDLKPSRQHAIAVADDPAGPTPPQPKWIALGEQWTAFQATTKFVVDAVASNWAVLRGRRYSQPRAFLGILEWLRLVAPQY